VSKYKFDHKKSDNENLSSMLASIRDELLLTKDKYDKHLGEMIACPFSVASYTYDEIVSLEKQLEQSKEIIALYKESNDFYADVEIWNGIISPQVDHESVLGGMSRSGGRFARETQKKVNEKELQDEKI